MTYDKPKIYIGILVMCVVVAGVFYTILGENPTSYPIPNTPNIILNTLPMEQMYVEMYAQENAPVPPAIEVFRIFISGEVENPGVFDVKSDARVVDLVEMAGGATQYADLNRINLAGFLSDGQHIIIPKQGGIYTLETTQAQQENQANQDSNLVNINTASLSELMTLPGIGTVISQNIINHRETHGDFNSIQDIQRVNRIGTATFENIRNLITV